MSKTIKIVIGLVICLGAFVFIKLTLPSQEEKDRHTALLCDVIRQPETQMTETGLIEAVHFYQENSVPAYVVHKPKFYEGYTQKIVRHYLQLSEEQQQKAKQDYNQCAQFVKD